MKIKIIALGKIKEKFLKDGIEEFLKRLGPYATIEVVELQPVEIKEDSLTQRALEQEAEKILANIKPDSYVITLEILGKQLSSEDFAQKIIAGKQAQVTENFMIIARIESLILEQGMEDAISRAKTYLDAGVDGIMIHSRQKTFDEIKEFATLYNQLPNRKPLIVVPSSYNYVTEAELIENNINVVIYANHLLRAAYPAMVNTAKSILENHRCKEASDEYCMKIKDIITLIPGAK